MIIATWPTNKQLMMLLWTPQMLKKSGTNKWNAMNYLEFAVRIFHVCTEKQSAVKPRDAISRKEEPALIVVSWAIPNTQYPSLTPPLPRKLSFHISSWYQFILFNFILENLIFAYFSRNNHNYSMFRDVSFSWFYRRPSKCGFQHCNDSTKMLREHVKL